MLSTRSVSRFAASRPLRGAAVLAVIVAGIAAYTLRPVPVMAPAPIGAPAVLDPQAGGPKAAGGTPIAPSFDVVRVGPQGTAVIAGRAEPGADVVVRDNGREVGTAKADSRGEFVVLPATPLPSGGRELTLAARGTGGAEVAGDGAVLLQVPDARALPGSPAAEPPKALLVPRSGTPRLLQAPAGPGDPAATNFTAATPRLTLDRVDYDDQGEIRFTGSAVPSAPLRLYVDNAAVGDSVADGAGRWTLTPGHSVTPGVHRVRIDHLTVAGRVLARVELPFQRAALPAADLADGRVVVQPGQNLWRIARSAYGSGVRYTVIFLANREQIRDPKRIYPGQAFTVPTP